MDDQTGIDLHERGKYSEDYRDHHEGDGDTPEEMPIERHVTDPKPAWTGLTLSIARVPERRTDTPGPDEKALQRDSHTNERPLHCRHFNSI
jgi:hypothetical protein